MARRGKREEKGHYIHVPIMLSNRGFTDQNHNQNGIKPSQAQMFIYHTFFFFFFNQNSSVNAWYYCLIHGGAFVSHYNDLAVTLHNMDEASTSEK